MKTILLVHGRGLKPDAETLRQSWLAAMPEVREAAAAGDVDVGMVWWFDLAQAHEPATDDLDRLRDHLVGRAFLEASNTLGLSNDEGPPTALTAEQQSGEGETPPPQRRSWLRRLLGGSSPARPSAQPGARSRPAVEGLLRDLARYFGSDPALRDAARARFRAALVGAAGTAEKVLVVAHDLGSVIAYETLTHRRFAPEGGAFVDAGDEVRGKMQLLTLGSPLAWLYDAQWVLYAPKRAKGYPRRLVAWDNVFDDRDPFAHPPYLADATVADEFFEHPDYPRDHAVRNPGASPSRTGRASPNDVYGYLQTEPAQAILRIYLRS